MNSVSRNGVQPSPSRPIVCMTIWSSMNSTPISATLRTPVGATSGSRRAAMQVDARCRSATPGTAIRATLLKRREEVLPADDLVDRREFEGEHAGSTSASWSGRGRRAVGLEAGIGERDGDVLELPDQEPEMRDDDGRSERRERNPAGVLDERTRRGRSARAGRGSRTATPPIISASEIRAVEAMSAAARSEVGEHDGDRRSADDQAPSPPQITPQMAMITGAAMQAALDRCRWRRRPPAPGPRAAS